MPLAVTAVVMGVLALAMAGGWGDAAAKLWGVAGILLLVVYVAAAQANSRLDDSSTTAWAVFALMGIVVAVIVFLTGADVGWWPVAIAAVIVVAAAAWAARSDGSVGKTEQLDDAVIAARGVAAVDRDRLTGDERRIG